MRSQLVSLEKAKKASGLVEAWKGKKTQPQKRRFHYDVFLLDPNVSKNEVHKQGWQKQTGLQRHVHGWMTNGNLSVLKEQLLQCRILKNSALQPATTCQKDCMSYEPGGTRHHAV